VKAFGLGFIFFVSLAGAVFLVGRLMPPVPIDQVSEKLAHFAAHKDEYDTLFVGSSRTYRQALPSVFDPLMTAGGRPTHSFNFGADAMFSPEDAYVFEKIAALRPAKLRRVFLEISGFNTDFAAQPPETLRARHWHDWHRTMLICRGILSLNKRGKWRDPSRWSRALVHVRLMIARAVRLGDATSLFDRWRGAAAPFWSALGERRDGAIPYPEETPLSGEVRVLYDQEMAKRRGGKTRVRPLGPAPLQSLQETIARVQQLGAEPVLFIAPTSLTSQNTPASQVSVPVLDFSDVERWPELFDPANRHDRGHLNLPGAKIFSRIFAEQALALPDTRR
jgi:hypothetical protein